MRFDIPMPRAETLATGFWMLNTIIQQFAFMSNVPLLTMIAELLSFFSMLYVVGKAFMHGKVFGVIALVAVIALVLFTGLYPHIQEFLPKSWV